MSAYELAQLNIATTKAPLDSPLMAEFVANLDRINALAEASPGFVWRLKGEGNDATSLRPLGDDVIVNMSVWQNAQALHNYVYRTAHLEVMKKRKAWFEAMREAYVVLWWVPAGHRPDVGEALSRLETLRRLGPTNMAFTFKQPFPPPGAEAASADMPFDDLCPA